MFWVFLVCVFQLPGRRGLLVHGSEVRHEDDSNAARGRMSRHLTRHGDSGWRFGLCGSATLPGHSDPGQSGSDSEQVHTNSVMYKCEITAQNMIHTMHTNFMCRVHFNFIIPFFDSTQNAVQYLFLWSK